MELVVMGAILGTYGGPLSWSDQINKLTAVKMYLRWMVPLGYLLYSPAAEFEMPRQPRRLPAVLTRSEVEQVINTPNVREPFGLRDRSILETLYSTGMRRMEIVGLRVEDLDTGREVIMIRQGKGGKDRVVPIGDRALAWTACLAQRVPVLVRVKDRLHRPLRGGPYAAQVLDPACARGAAKRVRSRSK